MTNPKCPSSFLENQALRTGVTQPSLLYKFHIPMGSKEKFLQGSLFTWSAFIGCQLPVRTLVPFIPFNETQNPGALCKRQKSSLRMDELTLYDHLYFISCNKNGSQLAPVDIAYHFFLLFSVPSLIPGTFFPFNKYLLADSMNKQKSWKSGV